MEESMLFDLIVSKLYDYRKKLEKDEDTFTESVKKSREVLEKMFDENQLKVVDRHIHDVKMREEELNFYESIKLLNYGVKIGMQLQKAFDEIENE